MSHSSSAPAPADPLRRAAYTIANAARQIEAALAHTPATALTWEDLRWAHAHLTDVLRLAPEDTARRVPHLDEVRGRKKPKADADAGEGR